MEIPDGWSVKKLDDLGFVGRGKSKHRPRNDPKLYGGKYPFIQTGDVKATGLYIYDYSQTYNEQGLAQSKLWNAGTLLITIAANIAETAILGIEACFPDSIVGFIADEKCADVKFIKYYIDTIKLNMQNISRGTTQDNLSLGKLQTIDFVVPPVETQRRIAHVLSAYDDLIENNARRIKLLEQSAHNLYHEWFIEFRYPNHENVQLVDSELGQIPQGWDTVVVSSAVEINPRMQLDKDKENYFISMGRLSEYGMIIDTAEMEFRTGNSGAKFMNGDTLLARITPSLENGKTAYVQFLPEGVVGRGSTEFIVMRSKTLTSEWVYCLARDSKFRLGAEKTMTGASGRQRVQNAFFDNYKIAHPTQTILEAFSEIVKPKFDAIYNLTQRNEILREVRDLLLPRLVSGQLDVSEIELLEDE